MTNTKTSSGSAAQTNTPPAPTHTMVVHGQDVFENAYLDDLMKRLPTALAGYVDLRSDTVTRPTALMRKAMNLVEVDDSEYGDPITQYLEKMAAEMLGMEAALFMPSGLMTNQVAILTHTKRGENIIIGQRSHISLHERSAFAIIAAVAARHVASLDDTISGEAVHEAYREATLYDSEATLLCLETPLINGKVVSLDVLGSGYKAAKELGLAVHLDGTRVFNAAVALGVDVKEITQFCDTVMFCLSKGLGAPVGSILCGPKEFIEKARLNRKLLGGGMRQVGIYAAAGIVALDTMVERLSVDHANAKHFATSLANMNATGHKSFEVDEDNVDANLVFFKISDKQFCHQTFVDYLFKNKVRILPRSLRNGEKYRIVMHHNVSKEDIDYALGIIEMGYYHVIQHKCACICTQSCTSALASEHDKLQQKRVA